MQVIAVVVIDETQIPESVHKETDPGARRSYHRCQRLLTDLA